jgi:hypothetical protein
MSKVIGIFLVIAGLLWLACNVGHGRQICPGCRLQRRIIEFDAGRLGRADLSIQVSTNACSFWVRDRVPEHQHTWRYEGCHFTTTGYIACAMQAPGTSIPRGEWLAALQAAPASDRASLLQAAGTLPYGRAGREPMAALHVTVAELCGEAGATPIR